MRRVAPLLFVLAAAPGRAPAGPAELARAVEERNQLAMENHDLGEHAEARDALEKSLDVLGRAGLAESRIAARTHLLLGVVYGAGLDDAELAFEHYARALVIDRRVELEERWRSEEQASIFRQAVESLEARPPRPVDCQRLEGLAHHSGGPPRWEKPHRVVVHAGPDLREHEIVLVYTTGAWSPEEVSMEADEGCSFSATIPAADLRAERLAYYFVVRDEAGEVVAQRGDAEDPYAVEIAGRPEPETEPEAPDKPRACSRCHAGGGPPLGGALLVAALLFARRARRR